MHTCECCGRQTRWLTDLNIDSKEMFDNVCKINPSLKIEFTGDVLRICDECWEKVVSRCPVCHELMPKGTLCDCFRDNILDYSNKTLVFPKYNGIVKYPKLRFGLEIETLFRGDYDAHKKALGSFTNVLGKGLCKFKYDGSLGLKGAEFVTMPLYYEHFKSLSSRFTKAFNTYASLGGYSWSSNRTGCHIHLSRDAFINNRHLEIFFVGMSKNVRFLHRIAKRGENQWVEHPMRLNYKKKVIQNLEQLSVNIVKRRFAIDRHCYVNYNNRNTVEVRIYKGTIKWSAVMSYIQHSYSMFEYTMLCVLNRISFTVEGYRKYVLNNKARFPELAKEI